MKKQLLLTLLFLSSLFTFAQEEGGTGLDFDPAKYEAIPMSAPILSRSYTNLPKSYSLKSYAPTPGNQGQQPSCVGWASGYGARTIAYAIKKGWTNKSIINQNTFSPSFVYNLIRTKSDVNCKRGSYIADAMKLMNSYGILKKNEFGYDASKCVAKPSNYGLQKAKQNKILTFERLARWDNPYNLVLKTKKALSKKNPVVVGMFSYGKLSGPGDLWTPPANAKGGGHAMVVVGYDDNKYGGAFEIMNSWGTRFRNGGFFWVRYNDFKKHIKSAYVLVDQTGSPNIDNNVNVPPTINTLAGEITLKLSNGGSMMPSLDKDATRNFNIVKANNIKTTYSIDKAYSSGTQFRIYLKSKQRGYVYLIGYGGSDKSVNKLYPFNNFSPFFNYTDSEIAIPNEDYFIEFDQKPGRDILCVLYSKEKLDIDAIINRAKTGSGDFVAKIKGALKGKMFDGQEVKFDNNKIAFKASSKEKTSQVVPLFISVNHQ